MLFSLRGFLRCFASCASARTTTRLNASIATQMMLRYVKHNRVCSFWSKVCLISQSKGRWNPKSDLYKPWLPTGKACSVRCCVTLDWHSVFFQTFAQSFDSNFVGKQSWGIQNESVLSMKTSLKWWTKANGNKLKVLIWLVILFWSIVKNPIK